MLIGGWAAGRELCHLGRSQAEGGGGQVGVPACALTHARLFLVSHRAGRAPCALTALMEVAAWYGQDWWSTIMSRVTSPVAVFLLFTEVQLTN